METCVGCGAPLAPTWKYCIHCGLAVGEAEPPAAFAPDPGIAGVADEPDVTRPANSHKLRNRMLLFGGIGIFLIGIALLVFAIVVFSGSLR